MIIFYYFIKLEKAEKSLSVQGTLIIIRIFSTKMIYYSRVLHVVDKRVEYATSDVVSSKL